MVTKSPGVERTAERALDESRGLYRLALVALSLVATFATLILVAGSGAAFADQGQHSSNYLPRTIITTDGEQDDMSSFVRYLAYADDFNTVGIVYTASQWHWCGDGKGDTAIGITFGGTPTPTTTYRCTGTQWIQNYIGDYAQEYPNFVTHDRNYPSPQELLGEVRVGNNDFAGETSHDTAGSELIKDRILDDVPGPLYIQAWGGLNTIVRALKDIQTEYQGTSQWPYIYNKVSHKVVIEASGFQDCTLSSYFACIGPAGAASNLNDTYLQPTWPELKVINGEEGYDAWGYPHGTNNVPVSQLYYSGAWIGPNIKDVGALGADEYTWDDGHYDGDPGYSQWDNTSQPEYSFVSEGDNVAYLPLVDTGLQSNDLTLGGWGGRYQLQAGTANDWVDVPGDLYDGAVKVAYDWDRWFPDAQNDFAARLQWGIHPVSQDPTTEPVIKPQSPTDAGVYPGENVRLTARASTPTGNDLSYSWFQYQDVGTYPGAVALSQAGSAMTSVAVPADAQAGQTISLILQVKTNTTPYLTRYQRFTLTVR